jgi:hypothetical protein
MGGETPIHYDTYRVDAMSLPAELFNEITESITIVGQEEGQPGDRRSQRYQLRTHVTLLPWNNPADAVSVRIRDLSTDGLGVLHSQRMSLDDQFVICFPLGEENVLALYTIVYWEPLAENLYAIGAQFQQLLEQSDVEARQLETAQAPAETRRSRFAQALGRKRKAS